MRPSKYESGVSASASAVDDFEASVKHCYSTWSESYYQDYYGERAPYPPVHRDLMKRVLREASGHKILDAGCGPASFLRELADEGYDLYGFDLTPEMVAEGQRVFDSLGLPPEHIWEGSILRSESFQMPGYSSAPNFDAVVCVGVLPHIPRDSDVEAICNLRDCVKPGGLVVAEARNQLFSLFTFNRYSHDFVLNELIQTTALASRANGDHEGLMRALDGFRDQFRMDLPPVRRGKEGEPGYDEVLSRAHNPFVLKEQFASAGLRDVQVLFYHYHCLPPMFESVLPELFRAQSLAVEDPNDWRGHFMASAFFVTGRRA